MRKQQQSQQSQSSASIDILGQTAQKESCIITADGGTAPPLVFTKHCRVTLIARRLHCLEQLAQICEIIVVGLDSLAGVSGYLCWSSVDRTSGGGAEPLSAPSPIRLEGQGHEGTRAVGQRREKAFLLQGCISRACTPPPNSTPPRARATDWQLSSSCGTCTPATYCW